MSGANIWVLILVMCAVILVSCTEEETVDAENNKGGTSLPVHSLDEPFENASISADDSNAESEQSLEQDKDGFAVSNLPPSSYLPEIPRISVHDVKQKIETGVDILIVDTRGEKYYEKSHVIGAVSLTLADLNESSPDLNGYAEIITYCTWSDENSSARVAQKLIEMGYSNVTTIEGGMNSWKQAGYTVEEASI